MLYISILTLFPETISDVISHSILKRALEAERVSVNAVNIRDFATDRYKSVDDHPYGGGHGMILRVDVIDRALSFAKKSIPAANRVRSVLLDPQGIRYSQPMAQTYATLDHLILLCGHYEGIDERVRSLVDEEVSVGDYILTGGELPALILADSVIRLIPGVLSSEKTTKEESFSGSPAVLEYPQYTRPEEYHGMRVPHILLSGNHKNIQEWRQNKALEKTRSKRPDLLKT